MSVVRALVTTSKIAIYAKFTWGRTKFQMGVGVSEKERSDTKGRWNSSVHYVTYLKPLQGGRVLCKSSVSWFSFIVDGRVKKKNHETRVLAVIILTLKWKLQISSAKITPIQTYLMAQVSSPSITPLFLFLFKFFFESI